MSTQQRGVFFFTAESPPAWLSDRPDWIGGLSYGDIRTGGRKCVYLHQPTKIRRFEQWLRGCPGVTDIVIKYVMPGDLDWSTEPS